jgi:hypothetical protein
VAGLNGTVLRNALDYRLLRALAFCATGESREGDLLEAQVLRDYLGERISLGKVADSLSSRDPY